PSDLWDQMYYGISSANTIIAGEKYFENEETKKICLGEAYFLRGFNYYKLVVNFGGVVLKTTPSVGVERSFNRSSAEECTNQLVEDLKKAYELLPEVSPRGYAGWTKATAGHFYAKAMLFRCSERN